MDTSVLILGGGIAGCSTALELALRSRPSVIVEKGPKLGGRVLEFGCKATDKCNQCNLCAASDVLDQVASEPLVTPLTDTVLKSAKRIDNRWEAVVETSGNNNSSTKTETITADELVIAVGMEPFAAEKKPQFGYGKVPNVVTGLDMDRMIKKTNKITRPSDGKSPKSVAFVQCVGSRDPHQGRNFCSHICCKYAVRFARMILDRDPDAQVSIFYMDIQTSGKGFMPQFDDLRKNPGVKLVRNLPGVINSGPDGAAVLKYEDPDTGKNAVQSFEMVVLSIGQNPPPDAEALAAMTGAGLDENGFLSTSEGIWFVGSCHGPRSIIESIEDAGIVAGRISQTM